MKVTTSKGNDTTFKDIEIGGLFYQYGSLYLKISNIEAGRIVDVGNGPVEDICYEFKDFDRVARIREMHLVLED